MKAPKGRQDRGSGTERNRKLDVRHVPTPEYPHPLFSPFVNLFRPQSFHNVRRKSKRVSSSSLLRVLNTPKFSESPFLRRTLRFTRKLLPVSQQTRMNQNEREWLNLSLLSPTFFFYRKVRYYGQVAHDG